MKNVTPEIVCQGNSEAIREIPAKENVGGGAKPNWHSEWRGEKRENEESAAESEKIFSPIFGMDRAGKKREEKG